jgi:hypothetical protein
MQDRGGNLCRIRDNDVAVILRTVTAHRAAAKTRVQWLKENPKFNPTAGAAKYQGLQSIPYGQ